MSGEYVFTDAEYAELSQLWAGAKFQFENAPFTPNIFTQLCSRVAEFIGVRDANGNLVPDRQLKSVIYIGRRISLL